jgi:hypothetical protein
VVRIGAREAFLRFREADRRAPDQEFTVIGYAAHPWRVAEHDWVNETITLAHPGFQGGRATVEVVELQALGELRLTEPAWQSHAATPSFRLVPRPEP